MTLFTIGYEGRTLDDFVRVLGEHGIEVLIDIRLNPISRKPGFSKRALEAGLTAAGIGYVHLRALGNPKEIRDASRSTEEALARYAAHMAPAWDTALAPIVTVLARGKRACLLCLEREPASCHRSRVVDALAQRLDGLEVHHLA